MTENPPDVIGEPARSCVDVEADLAISVDGPRGHATGQLSGSGRRLVLRTDRPEVVLAAAGRSTGAALAAALGAANVHAELRGPRGPVVTLEPGRTSRAAAVLAGTPHLHVGRTGWHALARAAWSARPGPARGQALSVLFASSAAGGAALVVLAQRRRGRPGGRWGRRG